MTSEPFSPVWGWTLGGAVVFPALVFLPYVSAWPLAALLVGIAGAGVSTGAAVATAGRRDGIPRASAAAWGISYLVAVLVFLAVSRIDWPLPSQTTIVTADGTAGSNQSKELFRAAAAAVATAVLGGALDAASRS